MALIDHLDHLVLTCVDAEATKHFYTEVLQMELAKVEALASGHRADFERERERADALMAELLKVTAAAMAAKEAAARLEGGQVRLCQELSDVHSDRDAWRSEVERLILIEYRRNERECLSWWKRLAGWAPSNRDEQGPIA